MSKIVVVFTKVGRSVLIEETHATTSGTQYYRLGVCKSKAEIERERWIDISIEKVCVISVVLTRLVEFIAV